MWYTLNLCPKCKDKLIEQIAKGTKEGDYEIMHCPNCGSEMEMVLDGKEKAEDREYKIILNKVRILHGRRDKCLNVIMQIGNFNEKEALEKLNTEGSVIFEGDLLHTYLSLQKLDEIDYMVDYKVEPDFPYGRDFSQVCPDCDEEAVYREIELDEGSVEEGFYCEKCNQWVSWHHIYHSDERDETIYHLRASLKEAGAQVKQRLSRELNVVITDNQIVEEGVAMKIGSILGMLKTYDIDYDIEPPYPHKILQWDK